MPSPYDNNVTSSPMSSNYALSERVERLVPYNHISYALYLFSYFTAGLTWIIPIVMNYIKRDEVRGTWLYSHFDWQIKTFWYSIVFFVIGAIMLVMGYGSAILGFGISGGASSVGWGGSLIGTLGLVVMIFTTLWHLYRIVRGWIALAQHKAVP